MSKLTDLQYRRIFSVANIQPESSATAPAHPAVQRSGSAATQDGATTSGPDETSLQGNHTPKLDAALAELVKTLHRLDAEITARAAAAGGESMESLLRASLFQQRIRITLMELEPYA
jgi:hypothetical protein